jgi:hypothetical protein
MSFKSKTSSSKQKRFSLDRTLEKSRRRPKLLPATSAELQKTREKTPPTNAFLEKGPSDYVIIQLHKKCKFNHKQGLLSSSTCDRQFSWPPKPSASSDSRNHGQLMAVTYRLPAQTKPVTSGDIAGRAAARIYRAHSQAVLAVVGNPGGHKNHSPPAACEAFTGSTRGSKTTPNHQRL